MGENPRFLRLPACWRALAPVLLSAPGWARLELQEAQLWEPGTGVCPRLSALCSGSVRDQPGIGSTLRLDTLDKKPRKEMKESTSTPTTNRICSTGLPTTGSTSQASRTTASLLDRLLTISSRSKLKRTLLMRLISTKSGFVI